MNPATPPDSPLPTCRHCGGDLHPWSESIIGEVQCARCSAVQYYAATDRGVVVFEPGDSSSRVETLRRVLMRHGLWSASPGRLEPDSVGMVEVVMELEDLLGIQLDDAEADSIGSFSDLIVAVVRHL